ncbi:hypothetical protein SON66_03255 [Pseudomonas syringae]|uniref:hypothetical protein n=1 Tax=Pseudomonas syringae TaxID=317 RepID=UPI002A74FD5F|nr:hypothetical protein [Pseudomonas syringae]MDY2562307.1 hypothetical protein [Pseudomonas syringae]
MPRNPADGYPMLAASKALHPAPPSLIRLAIEGFANKDQLALQAGYWCKNAPLWDGFLRLPSLLHAARQIAEDHPVAEKLRKGQF